MKKKILIFCLMCLVLICTSCTAQGETDALSQPSGRMDIQLAKQSAVLCDAAYSSQAVRVELEKLGFDAASIVQKDYDADALHSAAVTFARRQMKEKDGRVSTVYALVVRGTMTMQEAVSNLILGNGDAAMGFQLAAERVLEHWHAYIAQYPPAENDGYKVWITGHSRGGAVANLLAGVYFPGVMDSRQIFAYTFGTPRVQKNADPAANVYNFILDGDVMTRLPPEEWGYARHGKDIHCDQKTAEEIIVNSKEDTDKLMRTILSGGLNQQRYQEMLEPLLRRLQGNGSTETINYTGMILPFLQSIHEGTTADRMNLAEIMAYLPGVMPSHVMPVYLQWMDRME